MFKKYLKQLQEVQALIKTNKANLAKLEMPEIRESGLHRLTNPLFTALSLGCSADINQIASGALEEDKKKFYKYLHDLGEYFINFTDYCADTATYQAELRKLEAKERDLKAKLGII